MLMTDVMLSVIGSNETATGLATNWEIDKWTDNKIEIGIMNYHLYQSPFILKNIKALRDVCIRLLTVIH